MGLDYQMVENYLQKLDTERWLVCKRDASIGFLNGSCPRCLDSIWNMKLMKIWLVNLTHEKWNSMKNWLSMDLTLRIFSKTNSSSWLKFFYHLIWKYLFKSKCIFFNIKKPKCHLDWYSKENGRIWWKNENPCFENFSGVTGLILVLEGGEESQGFLEV